MKFADYERIKRVIGEIFEENSDFLKEIPIDIFGLANKMGFAIKRASHMILNHREVIQTYLEINEDKDVYGFTVYDKKNSRFVIYIDDVYAGINKQRFSVAHEIGHIVLGHGKGDPEEEEIEANYFAGYLLCPDCLCLDDEVHGKVNENPLLLSELFGISLDTALINVNHIANRKNAKPVENNYEEVICNCLKQAVLTKIRD